MSIDRRVSAESRRRRVIYQTNREFVVETAAERRASEKLREARRPTASYGSHVNRRLRGRWFSLVPVSPLAMTVCGVAVIGSAVLFAMVHWLSVSWAPLATNTELARPLRLDRPDSLGNWARSFFLAGSSATALLVYQLRRYKVDDYKGHYRLWRPVIILLAVMSVDSIVNLVPWCGAMIDAMLGKRMALAGADWIRIVLTVGGGALAIRLLAEVRSSRLSLVMMLCAVFGFAMPLASHWKVLDATAMTGWLIVTTAPLFAAAALWVSIGGYLRMLFREVRGLDQEAVALESSTVEKSKSAKRKTAVAETAVAETSAPEAEMRGGWFRRLRGEGQSRGEKEGQGAKEKESVPARSTRQASKPVADKPVADKASDEKASDADASPAVKKRSWGLPFFGKSAPKETARKESKQTESASKESAPKEPVQKEPVQKEAVSKESAIKVSAKPVDGADKQNDAPKRRWFGLRAAAIEKSEDVNPEDTRKKSADKKQVGGESTAKPVASAAVPAAEKNEASAKRSWFSLRRSGANSEATAKDGDEKSAKSQVAAAAGSKAETKRPEPKKDEPEKAERRGLGGWLRRDPASKAGAESAPAAKDAGSAANARGPSGDTDEDDDEMDDGSVDWSTMNKSERRRMRKEIKRGGRAA